MRIAYLADYPQFVPLINKWLFQEFSHLTIESSERKWLIALKKKLHKKKIPTSFVAISGENPIGFACLVHQDMETHKHLTPWLAGVYVIPEQRRQGIGTRLVLHAMAEAKELSITTLYLFTPDKKSFYERLGWNVLEQTDYRGVNVFVMSVDLDRLDLQTLKLN